jgi:hypothetical protein
MKNLLQRAYSGIKGAFLVTLVGAVAGQPTFAEPTGEPVRDRICMAECRQDGRACVSATRQAARICAEACAGDLENAAKACTGNPDSNGCKTSRERVRTCMSPCAQNRATESRNCRGEARTCAAECPYVEPLPGPGEKEAGCVADCAAALAECLPAVREQAQLCLQKGCSELTEDVNETCGQDPATEGCRLARREAHGCQRGCRDTLRQETRNCARNGETCVRSCPDAEPEPEGPAES